MRLASALLWVGLPLAFCVVLRLGYWCPIVLLLWICLLYTAAAAYCRRRGAWKE